MTYTGTVNFTSRNENFYSLPSSDLEAAGIFLASPKSINLSYYIFSNLTEDQYLLLERRSEDLGGSINLEVN